MAATTPQRVLLVSANRERLPSPVVPLGVLQVAGSLRDVHEVKVLDLCFEDDPLAAVRGAVAQFAPHVVGVGLRNLHTNAYDGTENLLQEYAQVVSAVRGMTEAPVVLGGAGFSLQPERLLSRLGAEHGVVGEGEHGFRLIVDGMARGERPPRIVRAPLPAGGLPLRLPRLDAPVDPGLAALAPPARDLVDPRYYAGEGTDNVQTKRGCAFTCEYCDYPDLEGRSVRVRDPEVVADEFAARAKVPGVSHMFIVDSVFNVPRWHALAVCRGLEARGAPLPWVCYASPVGLDDELVAAMARAGCVGVEIGSDSGTDRMLARLRKPFGLGQIVSAHERLAANGIRDCHTFVLGALDETPEEVMRTLEFVDQLDPDVAVFVVFMEDRESMGIDRARHRERILELLAAEAPHRPGWVVPELGIRLNNKLQRWLARSGRRGPSWIHLAGMRRGPGMTGASRQDESR